MRRLLSNHLHFLAPTRSKDSAILTLSSVKSRRFATNPTESAVRSSSLRGMLSLDELKSSVGSGAIDTVVVGVTDMYGRMVGKRFDADFFVEAGAKSGTHGCDYLLACDMEMTPIAGFEYANWERGFGDFHMVPDLRTLRVASWHDKTAMVLCDIMDDRTHKLVGVAPRSILRRQIERTDAALKCKTLAASELEYFLYETSYRDAAAKGYRKEDVRAVGDYVEDYHILQSSREEKYNQIFRRHLRDSGVPVENSKSEAGAGQHELNVKYADILEMADRHTVYKQCLKEVADQLGGAVTFMAKPYTDATGSGCHIHLSLNATADNGNLFKGANQIGPVQGSDWFKWFLGGWLKFTPEVMPFYAPTVNSYKRFVSQSWAPTRLAWSYDNRTAGYRVVGSGNSLRIECRIPGADCNVYLAFAASLASGLEGIEQRIEPPPVFEGDIYQARQIPEVPRTLRDATDNLERSAFAKKAFGEDVVRHYVNFFRAEQTAFDTAVTDWERKRYFERI